MATVQELMSNYKPAEKLKWRSYILKALEEKQIPLEVSAFTHPYLGKGTYDFLDIISDLYHLSASGDLWVIHEPDTDGPELAIFGTPDMKKPNDFWNYLSGEEVYP
jgi:sugar phosphate isomerase/epimerase